MSQSDFRVDIIVDPKDIARLNRIAGESPKLVVKAWAGSVARVLNQMRKALREGGGAYGVPTWAQRHHITLRLGHYAWGGQIQRALSRWGNPYRGGQYWGFAGRVQEWFGEDLQTAEMRAYRPAEASYLRRRLKTKNIGTYTRPARPFIEPFSRHILSTLRKEFMPRLDRLVAKEINKK